MLLGQLVKVKELDVCGSLVLLNLVTYAVDLHQIILCQNQCGKSKGGVMMVYSNDSPSDMVQYYQRISYWSLSV